MRINSHSWLRSSMITKSVLTSIIGVLTGYLIYLLIEPNSSFVLLFGGLGYSLGLILENIDNKSVMEKFHFTNPTASHELFYLNEIPEAVIIYSIHNNTTIVLLDFEIRAKPENYRLTVLKNLKEFEFRVIEDASRTLISLCMEYPEIDYRKVNETRADVKVFFHDIKERSKDFKSAIEKLIPGIVIEGIEKPDIFGSLDSFQLDSPFKRSRNIYPTGSDQDLSPNKKFNLKMELSEPDNKSPGEDSFELFQQYIREKKQSKDMVNSLNDTKMEFEVLKDLKSKKKLISNTTPSFQDNQLVKDQKNTINTVDDKITHSEIGDESERNETAVKYAQTTKDLTTQLDDAIDKIKEQEKSYTDD